MSRNQTIGSSTALPAQVWRVRWGRRLILSLKYGRLRALIMLIVGLALGLGIWYFLSLFVFNSFLIPFPHKVGDAMWPMITSGELGEAIQASLRRVAVGFALGSTTGILLGILMGRFRFFMELVDPMIELLRFLSPTAMITIALIWFGIGENSKYFLVFWGVLFIVMINVWAGVLQVPPVRERAARTLGAKEWQVFIYVVIPSTVPYIIAGLRIGMASAFVSIIPAELLGARSGLGFLLQQSGFLAQTDRIFVALVTITVLGFLADGLFRFGVSRLLSRYTSWAAA
jgi:NitT/TauT family transport system permease protein/taurine transport system permease protein